MKISEVKIKNFRGFGENKGEYYVFSDLEKYKLIVFNGFNGFGKTSFFDSIEWCITGKISRIQDKEDILLETNLKQSANLKFANEDERTGKIPKKDRVVEVILVFDDGTIFKRTSNNESLYQDASVSKVEILDNYSKKIDEDKFFEKLIESNKLSIDEFISTNILGQEKISDFLRNTNPKNRTEKLMKLIGQNTLFDIVQKSNSTNFYGFKSTIEAFKKAKEKMNKNEEHLSKLFEIKEWGNIEHYIPTIQSLIKQLILKNEKFEFKDEWGISEVIKEDTHNDNNVVFNTMELLDKKHRYLEEKQKELKNNINILKEERIVRKIINRYESIKALEFIRENNTEKLVKDKTDLENVKQKYEEYLNKIQYKIENNLEYKGIWDELETFIYTEKKTKKLKKNIWLELENVKNKYEKFINSNKDEEISNFQVITNSHQLDNELWKNRKIKHDKYVNILKLLGERIRSNELFLSSLSDTNKSYNIILQSVQKYILEQENIDECPICLNKDFSYIPEEFHIRNKSVKESLLVIIQRKISNNNLEAFLILKKLNHMRNRYKHLLDKYNENIITPIESDLENIKNNYNETFGVLIDYLNSQKSCVNKHIDYYKNKLLNIDDNFKNYTKISEHLTCNFKAINVDSLNKADIEMLKFKIERQIEILRNILKGRYFESYDYNFQDMMKHSLGLTAKTKRFIWENITINVLKKKDKELKVLLDELDLIIKYFPDKGDKEILQDYFISKNAKKRLEDYITKLDIINSDKEQIQKNSEFVQNTIMKKVLKKNEMVNWIFKKISPHPFFNSIEFDYVKSEGTNFKYKNNDDNNKFDIYLDHIFSSAQLNVLALSIFLGLGLTQRCSNLEQLFLDDPIQSMDDINILSYIDLMRSIIDSEIISKNIIISTHDDNFAKLLSIKMRNKDFKIYNFVSYGKEGPIII